MPDRQTLIPIIWGPDSDADAICALLDKWRDKIADRIILFSESIALAEALRTRTGRPMMAAIRWMGWILVTMRDFTPDAKQAEWISYLGENMEHFDYIQPGNCREEVHTGPVEFKSAHGNARIIREIAETFPDFAAAKRLLVAPWHTDIMEEAADYKPADAPMRQAILDCCDGHLCIYCGCSFSPDPGLLQWMMGLHAWSGIGYSTGAEQHGLKRLLGLGFEACVFFLPIRSYDYESIITAFEREPIAEAERDRLMNLYTTDIEP